ncbi:MAG TPA: hypothetical protein VF338_00690 [Leptolinea sp.]
MKLLPPPGSVGAGLVTAAALNLAQSIAAIIHQTGRKTTHHEQPQISACDHPTHGLARS